MGPRFFTKMNYMKSGKYMREEALLSSRLNIDEKLVKVEENDRFSCSFFLNAFFSSFS
mgnify:FL=1